MQEIKMLREIQDIGTITFVNKSDDQWRLLNATEVKRIIQSSHMTSATTTFNEIFKLGVQQ